jgi:hypothetical protein
MSEYDACGQLMGETGLQAMQLGFCGYTYYHQQLNVSPHFPLMDAFVLPYIFENKTTPTGSWGRSRSRYRVYLAEK